MKHVELFTDGGARGNPGPAGAGFVMYEIDGHKKRRLLDARGHYLGEATNNQAEYKAVILGLERAREMGATHVDVVMDSELAVKQLNFKYKVKNEGLAFLFAQVIELTHAFACVTFRHVRREFNKEADAQVNKAIDVALNL